ALDPRSYEAHTEEAKSWTMLAGYESTHGVDPRPAIERGFAELEVARRLDPEDVRATESAAALMGRRSYYELAHGMDPRPTLARAAPLFQHALEKDRDAPLYTNAGRVRLIEAMAQIATGEDPAAALTAAEIHFRSALAIDPKLATAVGEIGRTELRRA